MITRKCLKGYSDLILEMLDTYSGNTTADVTDFTNTDEMYQKVQKIFDKHLPEQEFLKEMHKLGM